MKLPISIKIYLGMGIVLSLLAALNVFLPEGKFLPESQLPASKSVIALMTTAMMLFLYGGLGFIGITFSRKLGFAEIWDDRVTNRQRFLIPGLIGAALGVFFHWSRYDFVSIPFAGQCCTSAIPDFSGDISHCLDWRRDYFSTVFHFVLGDVHYSIVITILFSLTAIKGVILLFDYQKFQSWVATNAAKRKGTENCSN